MRTKQKSKSLYYFEKFSEILGDNVGINLSIAKGKHIPIRSDDNFVVSYPRSGNRYIRLLMSYAMYPNEEVNATNIKQWLPSVYNSNKRVKKYASPRILKSHAYFNPHYNKVIYLVRDPRSVAVSYFYFLKKHKVLHSQTFTEFLPNFLKGAPDHYGNWAEHVGGWLGGLGFQSNRFLLVKYEDLRNYTSDKLKEILSFLDIDYTNSHIERAVELSDFEKAQKQEKQAKADLNQVWGNADLLIRKGSLDEWKEYFGKQEQEMLIDAFGPVMQQVGYYKEEG